MTTTPQSGAELLARIKPALKEDKIQLCMRPDLIEAWEAADEKLQAQEAKDAASKRLGTAGISKQAKKLAADVQRIEEEIADNAIWFHFRGLPKDEWRVICDSNPPRPRDQFDLMSGFNRDAVLDDMVHACMFDPVFQDCEDPTCVHDACGTWQQFVKKCNPSDWAELRSVTNGVNMSVVDVPKSERASRILPKRVSGSAQPATGE